MKQAFLTLGIGFIALGLAACGNDGGSHGAGDGHAAHAEHAKAAGHEIAAEALPTKTIDYVENFVLLDQNGLSHELYYESDASAIVLMIQGNGCPIVRNAWSDLKEVRERFEGQGVKFMMLNANRQDDRKDLAGEAEKFSYDLPILKDDTQLIAASLGVTRTAEVLVIDPKTWEIAYRGPVNDRLGYGRQKPEAREHYLKEALGNVLAGTPVATPARAAKGCVVNLREVEDTAAHAQISYSETIAPILMDNCVTCHQEGGIGPWAMSDYEMIEGFAPTIKDVIRTKRMPPWSADPHIGEFSTARNLSIEEQRTLVRWIEAGALRGEGPDPLAAEKSVAPEWPLGKPDLIVEAPAFDVPATGVLDYRFPAVANPIGEDRWVKAVTVIPGDKSVVHHALIGSSDQVTPGGEGDDDDVFDNYLIGFVPGSESYEYPENTGVLVKGGGEYRFQFHYTPSGKATTDNTKIGLYFHDEKPDYVLRQQVALNPRMNIPARASDHMERAYFEFDHPAEIYLLFPHAHFRGKSSKFYLKYADGKEETLLSVPKYDFNWQHNYALKESVKVPAGTKLVHETIYDNSEKNFANPDPDRNVPWGLQSADEMLYGSFFFRWTEETHKKQIHDPMAFEIRQLYGFADADMDGKLSPEEMPGWLRNAWNNGPAKRADFDKDGAMAFNEFLMMQKFRAAQGGGE